MKEKTVIKRNSTVAISPIDTERLDRFCRAYDITKKDFITLSLSYFEREGINPKSHESPKAEIAKITKRMSDFFAFFKKQEQIILRPLMLESATIVKDQHTLFNRVLNNDKILGQGVVNIENAVKDTIEKETNAIKKTINETQKK